MKLIKKGNSKIDKSCNVFNLPTYICRVQCDRCYARKAEIRFPATLAARRRNYEASLNIARFTNDMVVEINRSGNSLMRIHESGDFYSQEYVNAWAFIVSWCHTVKFYAYTKRYDEPWFEYIKTLPNFNLINSITPLGYNYGTEEYCNKLVEEYGYTLCPCRKGVKVVCMKDCNECLTNDKVCFIQH